jgi:hypothetical protein
VGWHVDDGTGVACDVRYMLDYEKNRVVQYLRGCIALTYATTLTGWHGNKSLGFTLTLNDDARTVTMSAPDALANLSRTLLKDVVKCSPRHIMSETIMDIADHEPPAEGHPEREAYLLQQAETRHGLGVCIWMQNSYAQMVHPTNLLCGRMHSPVPDTAKHLRHMVMHMVAFPYSNTYGGWPCDGLEQPAQLITPFTDGQKAMYYEYFSDASLDLKGVTGGVGMLAGGPIQMVSSRQHLSGPNSHAVEVVAGGDNLNGVIPVNGVLQELHIRCGLPTPFYLDSATTVFVAMDDTAARKSVWLKRRVDVLHDGVTLNEIAPTHIREYNMLADPLTKYLTFQVWRRHMLYMLNHKPGVSSWSSAS